MSTIIPNKVGKVGPQYLWVLVVIDLTFQLFNYLTFFNRHYFFWLIGLGLILTYSYGFFRSKSFFWMVVYIMIVILNYFSGDRYFNDLMTILTKETLNFLFPAALSYFLFKNADYGLFKSILLFFGIFLLESTIVSYWADTIYPGIMRLQSSQVGAEANAALLDPYKRLGLSDYGFPHAIPVIIPGIVYAIRKSKKTKKILFYALLATSCLLAYVSGAFTALLLTVMSLVMSIFIDANNAKNTARKVLIISIVLVPFLFSTQLQLFTVRGVQSIFSIESLPYEKLSDIEESIVYGVAEGSVEARQEKYDATWSAVASNFFLGTNEDNIGGHSSIPDRLAMLGIIGMIPFFLFVYYQSKNALRYIKKPAKMYYFVGFGAGLLMMFTKNTSTLSMWLFLLTILPGLLWWSEAEYQS